MLSSEEEIMRVEVLGGDDPDYAVVGCIHGDEPCGFRAIERFKRSDIELEESVKFIIANEKAFFRGKRFIDQDLNRMFPPNGDKEGHEAELAPKLWKELQGLKVLDLHSTESPNSPFGIISGLEKPSYDLARSTAMERVVEISFVEGGLMDVVDGTVVECGYKNEETAASIAYNVLVNFLACEGLINQRGERSSPEVFQVFDREDGGGYEFKGDNFQKVQEGEVYALNGEGSKEAEKPFHPVLMSTDGYEDMIGFKAEKIRNPFRQSS